MNKKVVILRLDIVSRTMQDRSSLVRVVKTNDNKVVIDLNQNMIGRGCYLKLDSDSIKIASKRNLISKALRCNVNPNIYEELAKLIK